LNGSEQIPHVVTSSCSAIFGRLRFDVSHARSSHSTRKLSRRASAASTRCNASARHARCYQGPLSAFATTRPMGRRSLAPIFRVGPLPTFRPARRGA
jgi:hypothetical protein